MPVEPGDNNSSDFLRSERIHINLWAGPWQGALSANLPDGCLAGANLCFCHSEPSSRFAADPL